MREIRLKNNLTQQQLAKSIGLKISGNHIQDIETNRRHPSKKIAEQLALFFNLDRKFFFDDYLNAVDKIPEILKSYRNKNNLTINDACINLHVSKTTWISWEHNKKQVNRQSFELLKSYHLI